MKLDPALIAEGNNIYPGCISCHGFSAIGGGYAPDLRASPVRLDADSFAAVVRDGLLVERGMPRFQEMTDRELLALRQYITSRAREDLKKGGL